MLVNYLGFCIITYFPFKCFLIDDNSHKLDEKEREGVGEIFLKEKS